MRRSLTLAALASLVAGAAPSHAIVGGQPVPTANPYAWTAAVYSGSDPRDGQLCGGTLVARNVVVSAAHCTQELLNNVAADLGPSAFREFDPAGVRLSVMVGSRVLHPTRGEHRSVAEVHDHPSVDLTVLVLAAPVKTKPLGYLRAGSARSFDAVGKMATILGWGATSEGGPGSTILREARVPIVSDASCGKRYSDPSWGWNPNTMICAGYEAGGTDSCQGDSGGPLIVQRPNGSWILAGDTSFGNGCAREGYPGVYGEMRAAAAFITTFV